MEPTPFKRPLVPPPLEPRPLGPPPGRRASARAGWSLEGPAQARAGGAPLPLCLLILLEPDTRSSNVHERQRPEVSDFVARFCMLRYSSVTQIMYLGKLPGAREGPGRCGVGGCSAAAVRGSNCFLSAGRRGRLDLA